jgi:hypothetical protein
MTERLHVARHAQPPSADRVQTVLSRSLAEQVEVPLAAETARSRCRRHRGDTAARKMSPRSGRCHISAFTDPVALARTAASTLGVQPRAISGAPTLAGPAQAG